MRKIGNAKSALFYKQVSNYLTELGAIEMTTKPENIGGRPLYFGNGALGMTRTEPNEFIMETKAGLLWLHLDAKPESSLYTVFARFDNVDKANEVLGKDHRLNPYSGKYNFYYSNLDNLLHFLQVDLKWLVPENRKVLTTFTELEKLGDESYEAEKIIFVFDGKYTTNTRLCIDPAKHWDVKNHKGKKCVMVDAVGRILSKSSKFQIIIDGELKKID
jgi:hypothetical protein